MSLQLSPISVDDAESFHACLDVVAREGNYLALLEAPALEQVKTFVAANIANGVPQVVARDGAAVVGWCDIQPGWHHTLRHCGALGMGLLPAYRGQGHGAALFNLCLARAVQAGVTRVELEVREDNLRARALYARLGFATEGVKVRGMRAACGYVNTVAMSMLV
ncbi:MAG: GNAT family N-acetyltransferase [Caldimonas sp.]